MTIEPEVVFNMDLANAPTSARFCREAAEVCGIDWTNEYEAEITSDDSERLGWAVDHWTEILENAGYCVRWDCGDVVVWDLTPFSDDERASFYEEMFA